jgi:hypothetical protein
MAIYIGRRGFIAILGGAAAARSFPARLNLHPECARRRMAGDACRHGRQSRLKILPSPKTAPLPLQSKDVFATGTPAWHDASRWTKNRTAIVAAPRMGGLSADWQKLTRARTGWLLVLTRSGSQPGDVQSL